MTERPPQPPGARRRKQPIGGVAIVDYDVGVDADAQRMHVLRERSAVGEPAVVQTDIEESRAGDVTFLRVVARRNEIAGSNEELGV